MKMYHATDMANLGSILHEGIRTSPEGIVYLCDNEKAAVMFVAIRGIKDILVLEVDVEDSKVVETFDHCPTFFHGARAFGYEGAIPTSKITNYIKYNLN